MLYQKCVGYRFLLRSNSLLMVIIPRVPTILCRSCSSNKLKDQCMP
jgi:hypothetical protein